MWAARRQPGTHLTQLAVLLILLGFCWFILSLPAGIIVFAVLVFAVGLVMNWVTTVQLVTMSDLAPRDSVTEAFGWLAATIAIGEDLGAAAAGVVVDLHPDYGFWLAAASPRSVPTVRWRPSIPRSPRSSGARAARSLPCQTVKVAVPDCPAQDTLSRLRLGSSLTGRGNRAVRVFGLSVDGPSPRATEKRGWLRSPKRADGSSSAP